MRGNVSRFILLATLTVCVFCVRCGKDKSVGPGDDVRNTDFVATESFYFKLNSDDHLRLRLEGINGNVSIIGLSQSDSVVVAGEKRVGSESLQDAEAHLQELGVSVQDLTSEVFVKTTQPDETQGRSYVVNYAVVLPKEFEVLVTNVNGAVIIDSINNSISVQNVNGQVTLDEVFGSVFVSLVNGQIQAEVTLPTDGTIDMATVNGGIDLDIPQSTSAEFSATVVNGMISMFDLVLQNLVSTPNSLTGTLGDGQGAISLSTVNGTISVHGF